MSAFVVQNQQARINDDDLTEKSCAALATVLPSSSLRDLDLSNNNLKDSGVKKLCSGLENLLCKLETLSLSFCSITEEGYAALASALKANPSHLKKLDFRENEPRETGVQLISGVFLNSKTTLRLLKSDAADKIYTHLKQRLCKDPLLQRELDLSQSKLKNFNVMQLSELLKDPHCRLQKLRLYASGSIKAEESVHLVSALNPSHLRELDLNGNKLDESGLQKLCSLLKNPDCNVKTLSLNKSLPEKACTDLVSALCTNPSYIKELNLSENKIGDSGIKELCVLLSNQDCKLQKLLLKNCEIKEEGCTALTSALTTNSSHMRELDLCGNKLEEPVKLLNDLMNLKCNLKLDDSWWSWLFGKSKTTQQSDDGKCLEHSLGQSTEGPGAMSRSDDRTNLSTESQNTMVKHKKEKNKNAGGRGEMNTSDQSMDQGTRIQEGMNRGYQKIDQSARGHAAKKSGDC